MALTQFRNTELTNLGFAVSNKASLGKTKFETTRAVSTDVDLSSYKIEDLKNLTSLPNEISSGMFMDYDMKGDNVSAIKINFNNENYKNGYTVRAVGIYAKEAGSDKEFLHSITVSDSPVTIPAVSGNVFDGFYLTVAIFSGNNKNISVKITDETNATVKYVDDMVASLNVDAIRSDIIEKEKRIKELEDDSIKFMGWIKEGQDLNALPRVSGIWGINGIDCTKLNGYPTELKVFNNWNAWGYLKQTGSGWIKQEICNVTTNNDNLVAYRIYEKSWHNWEVLATKRMLDKVSADALNHSNSNLSAANNYTDTKITSLSTDSSKNINAIRQAVNSIDLSVPENNAKKYADQKAAETNSSLQDQANQLNNRIGSMNNDVIEKINAKLNITDFNDLSKKVFQFKGTLEDGFDLNNMIEYADGIYECWNKNVKNLPVNFTSWFIIKIINHGGFTYMEYFNNLSDRYYRVASGYPKSWGQWLHVANFGDVEYTVDQVKNDLQNQINNLQNQLNNSLQFKGEAPNPLSNAKDPGIYILPGNVTYSDQPDGTNRGQMIVLDTDGLTNQMILDNHGNILNRSSGGNGTTKWK